MKSEPVPVETITVPHHDISREASYPPRERPGFAAESMSKGWRAFLAAATVGWTLLMPVLAIAVNAWLTAPASDGWVGMLLVLFVGFGALLFMVFGALIVNNRALEAARGRWAISLAFGGPVTMIAYWLMHVWPAEMHPRPLGT